MYLVDIVGDLGWSRRVRSGKVRNIQFLRVRGHEGVVVVAISHRGDTRIEEGINSGDSRLF
jgi:hypothetical protein